MESSVLKATFLFFGVNLWMTLEKPDLRFLFLSLKLRIGTMKSK